MPDMTSQPAALSLDEEKLRVVVFGDYGRGKTTFAGTFPKPLFIDTNGGMVVLGLAGQQPTQFVPEGYRDLEGLYFWVKEHAADYETIVIDSLDSLIFLLMDEITEDAVKHSKAKAKDVTLRMEFVPEQGDYFANQRQMLRFLHALRGLNKHLVITSSVRDKGGKSTPNVSDGMEKVVCDFASVTGELVIVEGDVSKHPADHLGQKPYDGCRALLTSITNKSSTKSRYASLRPYVIDPTFNKLATLVAAEYKESK